MRQLDGLRAIAALAVVVSHTLWLDRAPIAIGAYAVRLFFVLSGFLITGILLRQRTESISDSVRPMGAFYARRFLRICPIYYLGIVGLLLLGDEKIRGAWLYHVCYLSNVYCARIESLVGPPINHLWSLSVEEQFYLAWPAVILLMPYRWLPRVITTVVVAAPLWRFVTTLVWGKTLAAWVLPMACLDSLGLGAMVAYWWHRPQRDGRRMQWRMRSMLIGGALVLGLTAVLRSAGSMAAATALRDLGAALVFAWLINGAAIGFTGVIGKALESAPLVYLGQISYGIYLYHNFVPGILRCLELRFDVWLRLPQDGAGRMAYVLCLTIPLAVLSWHLIESPLNAFKEKFPYKRKAGPATLLVPEAQAQQC
jgi:peptidoglycan/LPS O-acetylase OafA/YrhL